MAEGLDDFDSSDSKLVDTFSFVLSFLREAGLRNAEQALVHEIVEKFPDLAPVIVESEDPEDETEDDLPSESPPRLNEEGNRGDDAQLQATSPLQALPVAQAVVSEKRQQRENNNSLRRDSQGPQQTSVPWSSEVDEYDNMDDVGYNRKPILSQLLFVELELDLHSEEGSEGYFVHKSKSGYQSDEKDFSEMLSEDEEDPQKPHELERKPPPPTKMPESMASHIFSSQDLGQVTVQPTFSPSVQVKSQDNAWDLGTIRIAEPVIIAGKSTSGRSATDESRPVLSRVESLSSSFKDFELERSEDEQFRLPTSEAELSDTDMVEFSPPGPSIDATSSPVDLEMFARASVQHSRTSSTDALAAASLPSQPCQELVLSSLDLVPSGSGSDGQGVGTASRSIKEPKSDALGGFSFPVTSGPEDVQKVYKSWPSVKSSVSDVLANNLEEVSGTHTADYLDENYRSKISSRAPSNDMSPISPNEGSRTSPGSPTPPASRRNQAHSDSGISLPPTTEREASLVVSASEELKATCAINEEQERAEGGDTSDCPQPSGIDDVSDALGALGRQIAEASGLPEEQCNTSTRTDAGDVSAHQIQISIDDLQSSTSLGGGSQDPGLSGASGSEEEDDNNEGADSASLIGDPYEQPLEWQVVGERGGGEETTEQDAQEAEDKQTSTTGSEAEQQVTPKYSLDENGAIVYHYDMDFIHRKYEIFPLQIIHRRHRTGFEETKDFPIRMNDLIAGRYQVMDFLGAAAFSRAVQALDVKTNTLVCLKIVKNNKDYFDQSLDEIKLLKFVNSCDPNDEQGVVRLYDYFYYKEHLFLVCELLRANLYEFQKYNKESGEELYFTNARIQKIAVSVLRSLAFLHSLDLIHSDLKPENILVKSYSRCEVKTIDLGSSCFITDQLSSYVQSRSYRAPEVILGLPYDQKVDVWSLGCILAELSSGYVLFQNDSVATLLARLEGILGPIPEWMVRKGRYSHRFYTKSGHLYERNSSQSQGGSSVQGSSAGVEQYELLVPKRTSLRHRVPEADAGLLSFISFLLCVDPRKRPTAAAAMHHPWLQYNYASLDSMS